MSFVSGSWRSEMQGVAASQDQAFGELLTVIPCDRPPNLSAKPDHAHAITIIGIFSWEARDALTRGHLAPEGRPSFASRDPWCSFARSALPWAPKAGDWVRRCCDGMVFEITKGRPDGVARIAFDLVQMGVPRP